MIFNHNTCKECGQELDRKQAIFCSHTCRRENEYRTNVQLWLEGKISGTTGELYQFKTFARRYLFTRANHQCTKCGWSDVHPITGKCPLQINHIDGNAANNDLSNLEVLCPNCHSMTENFGSLNKGSARRRKIIQSQPDTLDHP